MPDTVRVTTSQGCLSRLVGSIVGVGIGLLLFLAAVPLLWWNEGRAVHRARSLEEGASVVVDVPAGAVSPDYDGRLVHVTGLATTDETLTDPDLGITAAGAIRLVRVAETYQWREESSSKKRKKLGGSEETVTTYTYKKAWSRGHVDSSGFHSPSGHENPASLEWEPRTWTAGRVTCGAFTLPSELIDKLGSSEARAAEASDEEAMRGRGFAPAGGGTFYKGRSASDPRIGDVRVHFEVIRPRTVSVVAAQRGSTFESYQAKAGSGILLLERGEVAAAAMFKAAEASNRLVTWLLRLGGFLAMFVGLALVMRPLSVVGSVVPVVGSLVGAGTGLLSFLVALTLSLTTIAFAWLTYRPFLGGSLLAVAVLAIVLVVRARRPKPVVPPPIPVGR